jgi:hypothetical protein
MSLKFEKNRSVSTSYINVPMYYTRIEHPNNKNKELVIIDRLGENYLACWRNGKTCKMGIRFLVKATKNGFMFKNKERKLKYMVL